VKVTLITIFPQVVELGSFSMLKIAQQKELLELTAIDPREFTSDPHRTIDDAPFGGGVGMYVL